MPQTEEALLDHIPRFSLAHAMFENSINAQSIFRSENLLAFFNLLHWDSYLFNRGIDTILAHAQQGALSNMADFSNVMAKIAENFYYTSASDPTLANVGLFFQQIARYDSAIEYFQQYLDYFSLTQTNSSNNVHYHMGIGYYHLQQYEAALAAFRHAVCDRDDE